MAIRAITSPDEYIAQTIQMLRSNGVDQLAISTVLHRLRHDPPRNLLSFIQVTNELLDEANIRTSTELATVDGMIARMLAMVYRNPSLDDLDDGE